MSRRRNVPTAAGWLAPAVLALGVAVGGAVAAPPAASADQVRPLLIGAELPALTLAGVDGKPFDLNAAVASKPTMLIVYRGGW